MRRSLLWIPGILLHAVLANAADLEVQATFGFQGRFRPNAFSPVVIEIFNTGETTRFIVELEVPAPPLGREVVQFGAEVPRGTRKAIAFSALLQSPAMYGPSTRGTVEFPLRVLNERGRTLAKMKGQGVAVSSSSLFVVAAGPVLGTPGGSIQSRETEYIRVPIGSLPTQPEEFEGVDALILSEPCMALFQNPELAVGLRRWVRRGGRLIVWDRPSLYENPPPGWADFVPTLSDSAEAVGDYVASRIGVFRTPSGGAPLMVHRFEPEGFDVLARDTEGVLAVERWEGTGSVLFLAADPGAHGWVWEKKGEDLWAYAVGRGSIPENRGRSYETRWSTRFANGVCNQVEVQPVGYTAFLLVFLGFAVLVGPGISIALGKRRGPWVWVAVPLLSGIVAAGSYWFALHDRPGKPEIYQITFVDCSAKGEVWDFSGVVGLFSSGGGKYDLEFPAASVVAGSLESESRYGSGGLGMSGRRILERLLGEAGF
ncbi:MAG: hypothetical protein ACYTHM_23105, partial [Planctomycetota bacterium]